MQDVVDGVRKGIRTGQAGVVGRVIDVKGFSTLPGDGLVAIDAAGTQYGDILGRPGSTGLARPAAEAMLSARTPALETVTIAIHDKEVAEIGLSCGGQAEVLLQPIASVPAQLWDLLAERAPAALLTRIEGAGAGPAAMVVDRDGHSWGHLGLATDSLVRAAQSVLQAGMTATRRVEDEGEVVLIEAWVPAPRLVVIGAGDLVAALEAQGALLGWDCRAVNSAEVGELLDWAGATGAMIVLSHDPHIDTPALTAGLDRGVPYVGALGSRATQSRRLERLAAAGVNPAAIDRIHRPIGLDLGGRRAPEVALSIAAEILACHRGCDARPLRDATGPINDRPTAHLAR